MNEEAIAILAKYIRPSQTVLRERPLSVIEFLESRFYIPETEAPIVLMPHQKSLLKYMFDTSRDFTTLVYSTVKKSGKTAIAAACARWITETWGSHVEVYTLANDYEQARGRIYKAALTSIELTPGYDRGKRILPGQWKIIERESTHLPTGSTMRAVSSDYSGEAGSNPTATFWSELWGFKSEASHRLWDELTPVPTRQRSIRYVETYAGFSDESDLLIELYKLAMSGKRLTHDDIDWPFPEQPPVWINENASLCAYWDTGEIARRMPWQTPEYYTQQAATLRPQAFDRLHKNEWTSSVAQFMPVEWWDACQVELPPLDKTTPVVIGVDAAVSSDCCAIVGVTRGENERSVYVRFCRVWYPPKGGSIDLQVMQDEIVSLCKKYNVVEVAYDAYQLHKMMTDLIRDEVCWCRPFSQNTDRMIADKQLYDVIRDRRLKHTGFPQIREHLVNSAAKVAKDEDTKLRIIKKGTAEKIDLAVAMSMAVSECLRLYL